MDEKIKLIYYDRLLVGETDTNNIMKYVIYMIRLINTNNDIINNTYNFLKNYSKDGAFLKRFNRTDDITSKLFKGVTR